jgi:hypothetical protein
VAKEYFGLFREDVDADDEVDPVGNEFARYRDLLDPSLATFWHWSPAETRFLYTNVYSMYRRHAPGSSSFIPQLPLRDFLDVLRHDPVCVPGCYSFKLKGFCKALYALGHVTVDWSKQSQCDQGLNAMTALFLCDRDSTAAGGDMLQVPLMREIAGYNQIDCEAMMECVLYLRGARAPVDASDLVLGLAPV